MKDIKNMRIFNLINFFINLDYEFTKTLQSLSRDTGIAYSNLYYICKHMKEHGYIVIETHGVNKRIKLTNKGQSMKKGLLFINNIMKEKEHQTHFNNLLTKEEFKEKK